MREQILFSLKLGWMHAAAATAQLHGIFQVEHLVIDDVLHGVAGDAAIIKDAAHDNSVVRGIVMAERITSMVSAPRHLRASQQSVKESPVQVIKDCFEIVNVTFGGTDELSSAHLAHKVTLVCHLVAGDIATVTRVMQPLDGLAIDLGQQNVRDGFQHRLGRAFQQVGNAYQKLALAQADGVIDVGEREELDVEIGQGRAWPQLAVTPLKNGENAVPHAVFKLALISTEYLVPST